MAKIVCCELNLIQQHNTEMASNSLWESLSRHSHGSIVKLRFNEFLLIGVGRVATTLAWCE